MKFEMSSIISTYKSYLNIQLSTQEIDVIKAGGTAITEVDFLQGATIQVHIGGNSSSYPEEWPEPNIVNDVAQS